jgi:hypothetical protein
MVRFLGNCSSSSRMLPDATPRPLRGCRTPPTRRPLPFAYPPGMSRASTRGGVRDQQTRDVDHEEMERGSTTAGTDGQAHQRHQEEEVHAIETIFCAERSAECAYGVTGPRQHSAPIATMNASAKPVSRRRRSVVAPSSRRQHQARIDQEVEEVVTAGTAAACRTASRDCRKSRLRRGRTADRGRTGSTARLAARWATCRGGPDDGGEPIRLNTGPFRSLAGPSEDRRQREPAHDVSQPQPAPCLTMLEISAVRSPLRTPRSELSRAGWLRSPDPQRSISVRGGPWEAPRCQGLRTQPMPSRSVARCDCSRRCSAGRPSRAAGAVSTSSDS